ncbi:hypothetical protein TNCV_2293901 [Trichonephila clavipes]|nr:hypothetical protein TNCV_2293901 [Trichonephila clavipes]
MPHAQYDMDAVDLFSATRKSTNSDWETLGVQDILIVTSRLETTTTSGVGFFVDSTPTRAISDPAQPLFDPPEESSDPTGR